MKIRNRTAQIHPGTRNAMLDFLAATADGIIFLKEENLDLKYMFMEQVMMTPWQRIKRWFR